MDIPFDYWGLSTEYVFHYCRSMLEYKGYKISGTSTPIYMEGCESRGSVFKVARAGSIVELARIEGKIFKTIKEAEAHGLELAKEWVDKRWAGL